ncbi:enoyl-[acyl-carrier-protein] reductase FabK [Sporomusa acidovorans]|uniref:Probable nitronate monooxygenase n=1 Tax=Sporomusa acidovorans (strain ATCC 49682 / DSM 3132 / Mol) TaxID=1123286 RepID=A0ABZ3J3N4_SPOA4|nr:enoyl-[acyl-carrier-protein] reductase FabK [Sporomusa acidovorans]OZC20003.1 nitronate monooxygenase [Sporomusa acidovorans DSM 3132]SDD47864.1 enoyl-[acyl-carrier protein] reductase II [Sporomusa acidovorans]
MLNNKICQLLNIQYPILQGGMAWVATAELAAAVSNAGGLGIIGAGHMPPDALKAEIVKAKNLTSNPFGVNIMLMSPFVKEVMQVVIEERVAVVTTGAGNPGEYIPALKEIGTKVIPVVASVALAKRLERVGIDAIIAEGMESGGHVGEVTTMALVPMVVDAVDVPVIAAGGIGDARGVVAALALGAQGVQLGTAFAASTECTAHSNYKAAIIKAKERSTVVTGALTGHPVRVIANKLTRDFAELEKNGASPEELDRLGAGKLRAAVRDGDIDYGSVMIGQIAGMIAEVRPVNEIMQSIVQGIPKVMAELSSRI